MRDHVLFALYLTGRIGLWFALAGLFALFATTGVVGRAFVDEVRDLRWFVLVFAGLAALQFVAGYFLGHRSPRGPTRRP